MTPHAHIIGFAAPPVLRIAELTEILGANGWRSSVFLSPTAATWVDVADLERRSGSLVRVTPRTPKEIDPTDAATAVIAAPLTFNSLNKWAAGISDTLALGALHEATGSQIPTVIGLWAKDTLRRHPRYSENISLLTGAGATVLEPLELADPSHDGMHLNWARLIAHVVDI